MPEIVDIEDEIRRYDKEWLLFEVLETDETNWPVKGQLLCHSESRDEIHEVAMTHPHTPLQTVFAGNPVPPDVVVIL